MVEVGFEPAGIAEGDLDWANGRADGFIDLGEHVVLARVDDNTIVVRVTTRNGSEVTSARFGIDSSAGLLMFQASVAALVEAGA